MVTIARRPSWLVVLIVASAPLQARAATQDYSAAPCTPSMVLPVATGAFAPAIRNGLVVYTDVASGVPSLAVATPSTGAIVNLTFPPAAAQDLWAQFATDDTVVYSRVNTAFPITTFDMRAVWFGSDGMPGTIDDVDWAIDSGGQNVRGPPHVDQGELVYSSAAPQPFPSIFETRGCDFLPVTSHPCTLSTIFFVPQSSFNFGEPYPVPGGSYLITMGAGTLWQDPGQPPVPWVNDFVTDTKWPFAVAVTASLDAAVYVSVNPAVAPLWTIPGFGNAPRLSRLTGSNGGIRVVATVGSGNGFVADLSGPTPKFASLTYTTYQIDVEGDDVAYMHHVPFGTNLVIETCTF